MRALNDSNEEVVTGGDGREELLQEVLIHFMNDKPSAEVLRARQVCNEITPDAVSQINKLMGKPVTKKAERSLEAKESPRTVECSGTILSRSAKKGKPERIQVLVQFVGGEKITPCQTKFFERKNAACPWADREGNVFYERKPISLDDAIDRGLIK